MLRYYKNCIEPSKVINYSYSGIGMGKTAIITQSYKADYRECKLLCESMDRFAPDLDHFIFVNDEDVKLFQSMNYDRHRVFPKSAIMPWYMIRIPWRILGHHFHVSLLTIPVREWIVQQICKLGVFEVIGQEYDAVFNIDSESVFMRPLDISHWIKDGRYLMYQVDNSLIDEPNHREYIDAAKKLLSYNDPDKDMYKYTYMSTPTCFVRDNTMQLLQAIKTNSALKNWKLALCNTYRFSENYTYDLYTYHKLGMANHFAVDYRPFTTIDLLECTDIDDLMAKTDRILTDGRIAGVLLQKRDRKNLSDQYLDFNLIEKAIKQYWDGHQA